MPRTEQDPVTVKKPFTPNDDSTETTHPAFGQVKVAKVQGHANLYGSDFTHQHFVTLEIFDSRLMRNLSHDWYFPGKTLVEVAMSEAQWATLVSSFGSGSGVPCTLQYATDRGNLPGLPNPDIRKRYAAEAQESMSAALVEVKALRAKMDDSLSRLSKKVREELIGPLNSVISVVESTVPFIKESFDKHIEDAIEAAKVEVNAHMTNEVMRAGLAVLRTPSTLALEGRVQVED